MNCDNTIMRHRGFTMKNPIGIASLFVIAALISMGFVACSKGGGGGPAGFPGGLAIERVTVDSAGAQGNDSSSSYAGAMSGDGRYVVYDSDATNLVSGDTNTMRDVFVHDRQTRSTTRVSVASDGTQANDDCYVPSISSDGRYVTFYSWATNLVTGDTNTASDIFVHDRETGTTTRASVASDGTQGNGDSYNPAVSRDGRYVAFSSQANNLVSGDTNTAMDVFVHDRQTRTTSRVSVASNGTQGNDYSDVPAISGDGRYVAFESGSSNLVSGDTNSIRDIFMHDCQTGTTLRVSVASDGTQANSSSYNPILSSDGRYVAFRSAASNLVAGDSNGVQDIFVHDRQTGTTTRVSVASDGTQGNADSSDPSLSGDGRYVAFHSYASNLVTGDTTATADVFIHDRQTGITSRVSVAADNTQGNSGSYSPSLSSDGRYVGFYSSASNLVAGDTNSLFDVFVAPVK